MEKTTKPKNNKSAIIIAISAIVIAAIVAGIIIIGALNGGDQKMGDNAQSIDYTEEAFEDALNAGQDVTGKTVKFKVASVHPDSACGYDLWAGVHLNFCSDEDLGVSEGQEIVAKITEVKNALGSYMIKYEVIKK